MAFPPVYRYPAFLTMGGSRLHPGTTWYGGGPFAAAELQAGVLWRVACPIGYPDMLYLFSITCPGYFVKLTDRLARALTPITLSPLLAFADYREWFTKYEAAGIELVPVLELDGSTTVLARSRRLPPESCQVSYHFNKWEFMPGEQNLVLHSIYNEMTAAIKEHSTYLQQRAAVQAYGRLMAGEDGGRRFVPEYRGGRGATSWL